MKTLLSLGLLFASTAVFSQSRLSFLESVIASQVTPTEAVYQSLQVWGHTPGNFLSLGESHLEVTTVNAINYNLANLYLKNVSNGFTFCSETIDHFLNAPEGRDLQDRATQTLIFKGNSPNRTNFSGCKWSEMSNALTYSGFFHQYPFARLWPIDFPPTPVITDETNNIRAQLLPRQGMYVTQMEMIFLESQAAKNLMVNLPATVNAFRARVEVMVETVREIVSQQEKLLDGTEFTSKYGVFYGRDAISEVLPMPQEAWFLLTNRGYRLNREPFGFFQKMLGLELPRLTRLLEKIRIERRSFASFIFGPLDDGRPMQTQVAGLILNGESELLEFTNGELVVLEPGANDFSCFKQLPDETVAIACSDVF